MMRRVGACALGIVAMGACAHGSGTGASVAFDARAVHAEGMGGYTTELLPGEKGPSNKTGAAVKPKVTERFKGSPSSNDWWSSLIWQFDGDTHSKTMFPHPLAMKADAGGLNIGYPSEPKIGPREYRYPYSRDLHISLKGLNAPDTRVESWSDWAVTASWSDPEHALRATFGHGMPFVYARAERAEKAEARIEIDGDDVKVWSEKNEVLGITVHGHAYGLFAPKGAAWNHEGAAFVSSLAGKGFFSVALLPEASPAVLELFRKHAYAFVTGTEVTWRYDVAKAHVVSKFDVKTELVEPAEGRSDQPLLALYPHQWKATKAALSPLAYASPRGAMRLFEGASFEVERPFHGVVPILPAVEADKGTALSYLRDAAGEGDLFPVGMEGKKDSYWTGKSLGKVATLAWLAGELGDEGVRTKLVNALEKELDDWFDGRPPNRFYYDSAWHTLIGMPAGYQSGTEMNDHHFHYGYFLWAAATVAANDPAWAQKEKWGSFVQLLVKDVANWERTDDRFPKLRYFDPYAGHSWASGPAMFDEGNNEESSSEDVNFAAGLVLWGAVHGDDALRDLGAFLYETTVSAVEQYWLDVDHDVFPKGYRHPVAGILWGDGVKYDTWWDRNPVFVHGINVLPLTGASLYLGRRPAVVHANWEHLLRENRGPVHQWRDVMWMYQALDDAPAASKLLDDDHHFDPEFGNSWANTFHWIHALAALGHVDSDVLADSATYAAFRNGNARTYVAYNPARSAAKVTFTDGTALDVPALSMRYATHPIR